MELNQKNWDMVLDLLKDQIQLRQRAKYISPILCGCEIEMTALWTPGSIIDGVSYRDPIQYTAEDLKIVSCCDEHKKKIDGFEFDLRDTLAVHPVTGKVFQPRGYLKYFTETEDGPVIRTEYTEAEALYTYLLRYCGQATTLGCGCRYYDGKEVNRPTGEAITLKVLHHPRESMKCFRHHNDTLECTNAQIWHNEFMAGDRDIWDDVPHLLSICEASKQPIVIKPFKRAA